MAVRTVGMEYNNNGRTEKFTKGNHEFEFDLSDWTADIEIEIKNWGVEGYSKEDAIKKIHKAFFDKYGITLQNSEVVNITEVSRGRYGDKK